MESFGWNDFEIFEDGVGAICVEIDGKKRQYRLSYPDRIFLIHGKKVRGAYFCASFGEILCAYLNGNFKEYDKILDIEYITGNQGGFLSYLSNMVENREKMQQLIPVLRLCGGMRAVVSNRPICDGELPVFQYTIDNESQLLAHDVTACLNFGIRIIKCPECGRYFPSSKTKRKYCDDCQTVGARKTSYVNQQSNEASKLRKNIADRIGGRCGRDSYEYNTFCDTAAAMKRNHSSQEYLEWLHEQNEISRRYKNSKK